MLYTILIALLVVVDQVSKYFTRANIALGESIPFIPHVMDLTYVQNTGAAFSIMEEHTWLLALVSAVASVVLAVLLVRKFFKHRWGQLSLAVILAGAVGNLIDRVLFSFVTDMFRTTFINFAVFNVADICVVLGTISMAIYVLFFYDKWEGAKSESALSEACLAEFLEDASEEVQPEEPAEEQEDTP